MGVEPIGDAERRRPPVLKTGADTGLPSLPSLYSTDVYSVTKDLLLNVY